MYLNDFNIFLFLQCTFRYFSILSVTLVCLLLLQSNFRYFSVLFFPSVYFPLQEGDYGVVYFLGGFSTLVPAEFYSIVLTKVASHGFFVFGVDYRWPLDRTLKNEERQNYGQDINTYFKELEYVYMSCFVS